MFLFSHHYKSSSVVEHVQKITIVTWNKILRVGEEEQNFYLQGLMFSIFNPF